MIANEHYWKLERMYASILPNQYYRARLHISEARAEVVIPVRQDFFHAGNAVHGSVYFRALDDAAFFAVNSLVRDVMVLTVSFNLYLTRPISEGEMKATGQVNHRSRNLFVATAKLSNSDGQEIARGSGTFVRSPIRLAREIGYE